MELDGVVKNIMQIANTKNTSQASSKISLPDSNLSLGELASVLNVLANEYSTTLPSLLRKLDTVSGNLDQLDRYYTQGDQKVLWSAEEDELLEKGKEGLLARFKGEESVEQRKKYIKWKGK